MGTHLQKGEVAIQCFLSTTARVPCRLLLARVARAHVSLQAERSL